MRYEPLGNYVSLTQGLAVNKGNVHLFSDVKSDDFPHPLLRIVDMDSGTYSKYVSKNVSPSVIANEQTIVYTRTGQIGYCFRGYSGVIHNNSFIVKLISDKISDDYLFVVLQSEFVRNQALKLAKSSVIPDLTHDMFKSIKIPVCDRKTQNKIVNIYNCLNDKIALNDSICSDLESMAKLLYDYWFVQFDFPDENGRPYKSSGGKMVWNDELKREIPEGWLDGKLSDILRKDIRGIRPDEIGNLPYTPMDILPCNQMSFGNTGDKADANSSLIKYDKYSILFGAMRPYFHRVCIAPFDGVTRTTVFTLYSNYDDELGYSYETLNQDYCVNYANLHHVGTQQPYAEWDKNLEDCKIALPPKKLKKDYSDKTQSLIDSVIELQLENKELASLRDFLLPMLMNGQIKIEDVKAS